MIYQEPEHLLIDGYNLIRGAPSFAGQEAISLEAGRKALIHALGEYARDTGAKITLFFDGDGNLNLPISSQPIPEVKVIFSRPPQIADDLINEVVQAKHGAKRLRVITSDREIRNFAKRHKIRSTASHTFADEMEEPPRRVVRPADTKQREKSANLALSQDEITHWEKLFSQRQEEPEPGQKLAKEIPEKNQPEPKVNPANANNTADLSLAPESVDAWERLFSEAQAKKEKDQQEQASPQKDTAQKKTNPNLNGSGAAKGSRRQPPAVADRRAPRLSAADIDAWETFFNEEHNRNEDEDQPT
jgi:predicted RNA-binding protein with PIN domain